MSLAWKAARLLPKDDILHLYLNRICLGRWAYGVESAARLLTKDDILLLYLNRICQGRGPSGWSPRRGSTSESP
jgi:membrane peptidoglycan carboxypeptidase